MKGEVTYNGYGFDECIVGRTAAYVDQNDNHIAELTVRETLVRTGMGIGSCSISIFEFRCPDDLCCAC